METKETETKFAADAAVRSASEAISAIDGFYSAPEEERNQVLEALRKWLASPGRSYNR